MATQPLQPRALPVESGEIANVAAAGKRSAGVGRELSALLIFAAASFISFALLSFKRSNIDPSIEGSDLVGPVGATVAGWLVQGFGVVAWLLPLELGLAGYPLFRGRSLGPLGLRLAGDL
ncbi:MAG TPA: DNA translocase FtsK 4TM domain-containing protein, partial [Polyangiaceae bacterium]